MSNNKHQCGLCDNKFRSDHLLQHILNKHSKSVRTAMSADALAVALHYRIPMLWKVRWGLEADRVPDEYGEFAVCLICKSPKGTPIGKHQNGHGSVRDFLLAHARGPCRQQWNSVCEMFGAEPTDEAPPQIKHIRHLAAIPAAAPPPPPPAPTTNWEALYKDAEAKLKQQEADIEKHKSDYAMLLRCYDDLQKHVQRQIAERNAAAQVAVEAEGPTLVITEAEDAPPPPPPPVKKVIRKVTPAKPKEPTPFPMPSVAQLNLNAFIEALNNDLTPEEMEADAECDLCNAPKKDCMC